MGKGSTASTATHYRTREDGQIGCMSCGQPATRWIDMERRGMRRFLSTAYCADHGDWEFNDPDHTHRARALTQD